MKIVIDIPDNEIPKEQRIVDISFHFIDGTVCECDYPFEVLPKKYGRLIDGDKLLKKVKSYADDQWAEGESISDYAVVHYIREAETIIAADKENIGEDSN